MLLATTALKLLRALIPTMTLETHDPISIENILIIFVRNKLIEVYFVYTVNK